MDGNNISFTVKVEFNGGMPGPKRPAWKGRLLCFWPNITPEGNIRVLSDAYQSL